MMLTSERTERGISMFRKLRIQMTLFSTAITAGILILMTLACLFIAEKGTKQNSYTTFSQNAQSCISYLETQNLLSHQWLLEAQSTYGISIKITDNDRPLFFDKIHSSSKEQAAFEKAADIALKTEGIDISGSSRNSRLTSSAVFTMEGYYACAAIIPKSENNFLSVLILHPLKALDRQILNQRLAFFTAVVFAVLALFVFSWFFTRKMIRPLSENHRHQTEFIASASHELRSPLTVILSSLQAMEKASPEEKAHFSSIIKNEGNRMSRLIGDMLSIANADNHSWKIFPAPCELDTLLLDTFEKYEHLMQEKELHLHISLPDEILPPCKCDSSRISQVLSILLDNALAYVPPGKDVFLSLSQGSRHFYLTASDNGPGIPDKQKASVFHRFYRADQSRNNKEHFGLGLCIAQEIIQLHKGTLKITDTPGGGATFTIRLPK